MTIKNIIRKSLETILVASPLLLSGAGLINEYRNNRIVVQKHLGKETTLGGSTSYNLLPNGNILVRQYSPFKWGMFAPVSYEISQDNPRYQEIMQNIGR